MWFIWLLWAVVALDFILIAANAIAWCGGFERLLCTVFRIREIHKPEGLYLRRFYLSPRVRWLPFQIFLHNIRLDDSRDLHDHPWPFVTIILCGSYREFIRLADGSLFTRVLRAGSIRFNRAEHVHRVEIIKPVWSLVIARRPRRKWGFWTEEVTNGGQQISRARKWIAADEFLNDPTVYDWPEDRL